MSPRPTIQPDAALGLALAIVAASVAPMVLLDKKMNVVAASHSFCRAFEIDAATIEHRPLLEIGSGEWNVPQLRSLFNIAVSGFAEIEAYEMDLNYPDRPVRRLVLTAHRLDYADATNIRVLLSISDVTDARHSEEIKNDLIREKNLLLRQVQNRVANSLQIITSVLMQNARQMRLVANQDRPIKDPVTTIGDLEAQLTASEIDHVELRPYFTELCKTIGASMIRDRKHLTLNVAVDASVAGANVSVSLGLIVTELVLNAIKHGFPRERHGTMLVDYHADGADWTLSVTDDGVGMPKAPDEAKAGLGTSIVEALANQLRADVQVTDRNPGTAVAIVHLARLRRPVKADTSGAHVAA